MFKLISIISLLSTSAIAKNKSICGPVDDRIHVATNTKVLRMTKQGEALGCSATMISKTCAITAGHCVDYLYKGEVNPPKSDGTFDGNNTTPENTFIVDQESIEHEYDKYSYKNGKDWALFKFKKNEQTGKFPGEDNNFYPVDFENAPVPGEEVTIYGFGLDYDTPELSAVLQINTSTIDNLDYNTEGEEAIIQHTVDTMGGNSGSSVLRDGKIVGVHTNGGCHSAGGANEATAILAKANFLKAIKACLASE